MRKRKNTPETTQEDSFRFLIAAGIANTLKGTAIQFGKKDPNRITFKNSTGKTITVEYIPNLKDNKTRTKSAPDYIATAEKGKPVLYHNFGRVFFEK